jgi:hypothetical protein
VGVQLGRNPISVIDLTTLQVSPSPAFASEVAPPAPPEEDSLSPYYDIAYKANDLQYASAEPCVSCYLFRRSPGPAESEYEHSASYLYQSLQKIPPPGRLMVLRNQNTFNTNIQWVTCHLFSAFVDLQSRMHREFSEDSPWGQLMVLRNQNTFNINIQWVTYAICFPGVS